jgi:hypothetical protein
MPHHYNMGPIISREHPDVVLALLPAHHEVAIEGRYVATGYIAALDSSRSLRERSFQRAQRLMSAPLHQDPDADLARP